MVTTIETTCRQCGRGFQPIRQVIRAGLWRICPAWRERENP